MGWQTGEAKFDDDKIQIISLVLVWRVRVPALNVFKEVRWAVCARAYWLPMRWSDTCGGTATTYASGGLHMLLRDATS